MGLSLVYFFFLDLIVFVDIRLLVIVNFIIFVGAIFGVLLLRFFLEYCELTNWVTVSLVCLVFL